MSELSSASSFKYESCFCVLCHRACFYNHSNQYTQYFSCFAMMVMLPDIRLFNLCYQIRYWLDKSSYCVMIKFCFSHGRHQGGGMGGKPQNLLPPAILSYVGNNFNIPVCAVPRQYFSGPHMPPPCKILEAPLALALHIFVSNVCTSSL